MKAKVNKDICIGCGACTQIAENVFEFGSDGLAEVKKDITEIKQEDKEFVLDAEGSCPVGAITVQDESNTEDENDVEDQKAA